MLTKNPNNIILDASMGSFRDEIDGRLKRVVKSLHALANKDGLYAWEHRQMVDMYQEVLNVIERRYGNAKIAREEPLPTVDEHGIPIEF